MPLLLFKLATLFSFCGGPLLVCELLKPRLGQDPAFVVGMAPVALVLVPTRELALQVVKVCRGFKRSQSVRAVAVFGGQGKSEQVGLLEEGVVAEDDSVNDIIYSNVRCSPV